MSALSVASVRSRIATAVSGLSGWKESRSPYSSFGRDPASVAHLGYSVGVIQTRPVGDRQRVAEGTTVKTTAAVRFLYRLRPKDQITDYDLALDAEHDLVKACMDETIRADLQVLFSEVPIREVDDAGEWFLGEVHFTCMHRMALQ